VKICPDNPDLVELGKQRREFSRILLSPAIQKSPQQDTWEHYAPQQLKRDV